MRPTRVPLVPGNVLSHTHRILIVAWWIQNNFGHWPIRIEKESAAFRVDTFGNSMDEFSSFDGARIEASAKNWARWEGVGRTIRKLPPACFAGC